MTTLNIETLKKIIEHLDDEFNVHFKSKDDIISPLCDVIEMDMENKRLILKK